MFEHVDRRGQVSLVPLTQETQKFFAANIPGSGRRAGHVDPRETGKIGPDPVRLARAALTARELQVFDSLISGLSNKQIAHELSISPRTVEGHRASLMQKMGVRNAAALIRVALNAA